MLIMHYNVGNANDLDLDIHTLSKSHFLRVESKETPGFSRTGSLDNLEIVKTFLYFINN